MDFPLKKFWVLSSVILKFSIQFQCHSSYVSFRFKLILSQFVLYSVLLSTALFLISFRTFAGSLLLSFSSVQTQFQLKFRSVLPRFWFQFRTFCYKTLLLLCSQTFFLSFEKKFLFSTVSDTFQFCSQDHFIVGKLFCRETYRIIASSTNYTKRHSTRLQPGE